MQETFSAEQVCKAAQVTYRQLDYWDRSGLVHPTVAAANGSGSKLRYSENDLRKVELIRVLLDIGVSLQAIRRAVERAGGFKAGVEALQRRIADALQIEVRP